jgi:flagellar motor protein MotB
MRGKSIVIALTGLVAAMGTIGCNQDKEMLLACQNDRNILKQRNEELQTQIAQAESDKQRLASERASADDDLRRTQADLADARDRIDQLQARLDQQPSTPAGSSVATAKDWTATAFGDRVTVGSDVLFAPGRASLTAAGQRRLATLAADLKTTYAGLPVRVYGHTDTDPIRRTKHLWKDNLDLSANRAMAVTRYLISRGVDPERVETIAMGPYHPMANKQQSRRVEIFVVKPLSGAR